MPNQPDSRYGRLIVALVLAMGLLVTTASWWAIRIHEGSGVRWVTKLAGEAVRSDIVTDMEWQIVGLDRLALLWEAADPPQPLWTKNAQLYLEHRPGSVAVEWLTPTGERRALVTKNDTGLRTALAFDGIPKALLEAVKDKDVAMISAPTVVGDQSQWAIAHPVYVKGECRGYIVSFFDLKQSLNYILDDIRGLGFSFAVLTPGQPEYLLPGSSREHEQEWGTVVDVPLSGVTWQVRVWPKADVVNVIKSSLPFVTAAAGLALTLLLALTLHFAFGAAVSSARMREANRSLQREITMREGAQEELRRAHAELETRIDKRTAELAGANALLQKEVAEHLRAEDLLQELTGRLFHLQDEERRRLARELHDGAVQNMVALAIDIAMIKEGLVRAGEGTRELLDECARLVDKSINELRTVSYLLHPPYFDELGLVSAVKDFVEGFATRTGIHVSLEVAPKFGRPGHDLELGMYRVIQEALSNVHRHAQSSTARVLLDRDGDIVQLEVSDNGRGIPPEILGPNACSLRGVGIAAMRERVRLLRGTLEIQTSSTGTRIHVRVPAINSLVSTTVMSISEPGSSALEPAGG